MCTTRVSFGGDKRVQRTTTFIHLALLLPKEPRSTAEKRLHVNQTACGTEARIFEAVVHNVFVVFREKA